MGLCYCVYVFGKEVPFLVQILWNVNPISSEASKENCYGVRSGPLPPGHVILPLDRRRQRHRQISYCSILGLTVEPIVDALVSS